MEYIYSAMVLHAAGKDITEEGIKNILEAAGIEVNDTRIKALTSSLEGIDIEEAMASAVSAAPAAAAPALGGEEKKEEVKK
ncbi:MAG: 50S ribosomal protein P1, partial [Thermoplasmata archaeon]|nr:50S ribosomal protein P1 [Thermoplasmata archaeon]